MMEAMKTSTKLKAILEYVYTSFTVSNANDITHAHEEQIAFPVGGCEMQKEADEQWNTYVSKVKDTVTKFSMKY